MSRLGSFEVGFLIGILFVTGVAFIAFYFLDGKDDQ
jgi:hypothetical protein